MENLTAIHRTASPMQITDACGEVGGRLILIPTNEKLTSTTKALGW